MFDQESSSTSIFYDLYKNDNIGHRMISTIECEILDPETSVIFCRNKMKDVIRKHPHFGCRIKNHNWIHCHVDYEKLIYHENLTRDEIVAKMLNVPFDDEHPSWRGIVTNDDKMVFLNDHTYGDGAFVSEILRSLFDDTSVNNIPVSSSHKKRLSFLSKVFLFFKILYLIYMRFTFITSIPDTDVKHENTSQVCLAKLSISEIKQKRDRFSCKDGSHISINDWLHTLLVKTNSSYFEKNIISSAAMFNLRTQRGDFQEKNKLGYILLANQIDNNEMPEALLCDVHNFMRFYKETPITPTVTYLLQLYYQWNREGACQFLKSLNRSVDFVITNLSLNLKDKTIQHGIKVKNIHGTVTPCDAKQIYSITSYGDTMNIYLTYHTNIIPDITYFKKVFNNSLTWMSS